MAAQGVGLKLTKRTVEAAKPRAAKYHLFDTALPGFALCLYPSGERSYVVDYRTAGGRQRRMALGRHGVLTADQARRRAQDVLSAVLAGRDPLKERRDALHAPTLAELADRYLADHATPKKRPKSVYEDRRILARYILPKFGRRKVAELARVDVDRLHASMRATPIQANRVLFLLSTMLNLAEEWGLRPAGLNPCRRVERYAERKRQRFLSDDELARLGAALAEAERDNLEDPLAVAAVRLLVFTGCRRSEVLSLRWEHVDFERACLNLPSTKTGPATLILGPPALEVLRALPRSSEWVFPGRGTGPLYDLKGPWRRLRTRAGLASVRLHDLRHTHASVGVGVGLSLPLIGALLGHRQASTTQRYAHLAADPVRVAAERVASHLEANLLRGVQNKAHARANAASAPRVLADTGRITSVPRQQPPRTR